MEWKELALRSPPSSEGRICGLGRVAESAFLGADILTAEAEPIKTAPILKARRGAENIGTGSSVAETNQDCCFGDGF